MTCSVFDAFDLLAGDMGKNKGSLTPGSHCKHDLCTKIIMIFPVFLLRNILVPDLFLENINIFSQNLVPYCDISRQLNCPTMSLQGLLFLNPQRKCGRKVT